MVDTLYKEVNRAYGLRPYSIDYDQLAVDNDNASIASPCFVIWIVMPLLAFSMQRPMP